MSLKFGCISGNRLQVLYVRDKSELGSESSSITCIFLRMVLEDLVASGSQNLATLEKGF